MSRRFGWLMMYALLVSCRLLSLCVRPSPSATARGGEGGRSGGKWGREAGGGRGSGYPHKTQRLHRGYLERRQSRRWPDAGTWEGDIGTNNSPACAGLSFKGCLLPLWPVCGRCRWSAARSTRRRGTGFYPDTNHMPRQILFCYWLCPR